MKWKPVKRTIRLPGRNSAVQNNNYQIKIVDCEVIGKLPGRFFIPVTDPVEVRRDVDRLNGSRWFFRLSTKPERGPEKLAHPSIDPFIPLRYNELDTAVDASAFFMQKHQACRITRAVLHRFVAALPSKKGYPMFRYRLTVLVIAGMYFGCASTRPQINNEALLPEIDVIQVKEHSDEALKLAQEAKLDVEVVTNKLTETDNKLIILGEEVSSVSIAKIEELENRLALLIEAYKDLQAQVTAIESMPRYAPAPVKKKKGPATFSPAAAAPLLGSTEYELYQSALRTFNSRAYGKAIELFTDVLKQYPDGEYAANARYWIGESYYAQGDFASGVAAFTHVFDVKNSSKADDAQFKIGLSYLKMGQPAMAREELKKLINRYPASEYIDRAKKYLGEIK
jgi:tol-pal system protein YbgF